MLLGDDSTCAALQRWSAELADCPTGLELGAVLAARPPRPAVLDQPWRQVPGVADQPPALPAGPWEWAAWKKANDDYQASLRVPAAAAAIAHNDTKHAAAMWWGNTLVDTLEARKRLLSHLHAAQAADAAELATHYPGSGANLPNEVGCALRIAESEAGHLLTLGQRLATDLPGTAAALHAGLIGLDVATAISDATTTVNPAVAAQVEERVLPVAPEMTRRQVYRHCQKLILLLDPDGAADRNHAARQRRGTWRELTDHGMARLTLFGPVEKIAAIWHAGVVMGDHARTPGDDRTHSQRRFDAIADWAEQVLINGGTLPGHDTDAGRAPGDAAFAGRSHTAAATTRGAPRTGREHATRDQPLRPQLSRRAGRRGGARA